MAAVKRRTTVSERLEHKRGAARGRQRNRRRLAVVYDIEGPRVRLGMAWFASNLVAMLAGVVGLALLYGLTAAVAALQTARCWRKQGARPNRAVAGLGVLAMVAAGAFTTGALGAAILALVGAAVHVARSEAASSKRRRIWLVDAAATVRCALFPGFAAACVVVAARFELGAAIVLVLIAAAYETGDYIVGSGSPNPYEGPVAGAIAILVVSFAVTAAGIKPLGFPAAFVMGALACVLCPLGQLVASAVLPSAAAPASALRRIDSLLLLAPAWALGVGWLT